MAAGRRRRGRKTRMIRFCLSAAAIVLVIAVGIVGAQIFETRVSVKVENAGLQMTAHVDDESAAQVFVNGRWYRQKDVETLLVMGIDDYGAAVSSGSYNNAHQADFFALFIRDVRTGESSVIHINRDTMTDITMLGVTGQAAGVQHAQLALAYNYGQGQNDSSRNTADAVSNLLYGMEIDHYITVTMAAVPIVNDWAGGVEIEVQEDLTSINSAWTPGAKIHLQGDQALGYVRTRKGLDDSTNINRMERQRQYASAWISAAQTKLNDSEAVVDLILQMSDFHYSDCTAEELAEYAGALGETPPAQVHTLPGEAVKGEQFMEYYAEDEGIQQLVLELFYEPAGN